MAVTISKPAPTVAKLKATTTVEIDGKEYEVNFEREEIIAMGHVDFTYEWPADFPESAKEQAKELIEEIEPSEYSF